MDDVQGTLKNLQNSPKGRLDYHNGWDERPYAVTSLISKVQEEEIDKPNRKIMDQALRTFSPENHRVHAKPRRGRHSFPENYQTSNEVVSPSTLNSFIQFKIEQHEDRPYDHIRRRLDRQACQRRSEPRIEIEEVNDWNSDNTGELNTDLGFIGRQRVLLTPPTNRTVRRKKSVEGSPIYKPSPTFSSSTLTQTHSSTTSDATSTTPTRNPTQPHGRISNRLGIRDEVFDEDKLDEDLYQDFRHPFEFIKDRFDDLDQKVLNEIRKRAEAFHEADKRANKLAEEKMLKDLEAIRIESKTIQRTFVEKDNITLQESQVCQQRRLNEEERLLRERQLAADDAERNRRAIQEAAQKQERLRIQKIQEEEQKIREEEETRLANLEKERQRKAAEEEKRLADEAAAAAAKQRSEDEIKQSMQPKVETDVQGLSGLILKDDLLKFTKTHELLKQFEEPVANIDGKDPASKAFYIGAVKCINTPLNALADTNEHEILKKVEHFSKLLSGEPVSGGGSMTTPFSCKSIQNGQLFVMKTLAFRFVKKSEADVTRGKSTVQPLATVGVHLCRKFPVFASLVQANMYKLCPFLVPFSYPQGDRSIQEYAKELGHDLSGTESAIQQTFLERLKGYCTLYALMVLRIQKESSFDCGEATEFFTLGGAWQIIAGTMKLVPQVDVTATVIHTLLDILDDALYAVYKTQFAKLMRLLILNYMSKIKSITPPTRSGSVSRLQIYLEKKYSV